MTLLSHANIVAFAVVVGSYLLGSVPFAYLVVKIASGKDIRKVGSGNVGATNATRAAGWLAGLLVLMLDVGKGALPVVLGRTLVKSGAAPDWVVAGAALAPVLGHCFPIWLRFKGGKGVATAAGAFLLLSPIAAALTAAVWLVMMAIWRIVSLASIVAVASFPLWLHFVAGSTGWMLASGVAVSCLIILRHKANIQRLVRGVEPRIGEKHPGDRRKE